MTTSPSGYSWHGYSTVMVNFKCWLNDPWGLHVVKQDPECFCIWSHPLWLAYLTPLFFFLGKKVHIKSRLPCLSVIGLERINSAFLKGEGILPELEIAEPVSSCLSNSNNQKYFFLFAWICIWFMYTSVYSDNLNKKKCNQVHSACIGCEHVMFTWPSVCDQGS